MSVHVEGEDLMAQWHPKLNLGTKMTFPELRVWMMSLESRNMAFHEFEDHSCNLLPRLL
jgi:hypothetical protein